MAGDAVSAPKRLGKGAWGMSASGVVQAFVIQGQMLDGGIVWYCPSSAAAMLMSDPREAMRFAQRSAAVATVASLKRMVREQGLAAMRFSIIKTVDGGM